MTENRTVLAEKYGERTVTSLDDFVEHTGMAARLVAFGRDRFFADEFVMLAAEAVAIRLGESINRMDKTFLADHSHLGLQPILSTRHVIAHGYDIIDHEVLWRAYAERLPGTATAVRSLLGDVASPITTNAGTA
ncbi:hypothetical protein GCM10027059_20850 [Myceligenerans halotolerans]